MEMNTNTKRGYAPLFTGKNSTMKRTYRNNFGLNPRRMIMVATVALLGWGLTACNATTGQHSAGGRIDTAAIPAPGARESLEVLERAYKRNSDDAAVATRYGRALREANRLQRSAIVLAPFADDGKKFPQAKIEYAATQAAMGDYTSAEKYVRAAIAQDEKNAQAYHVLGVTLEAQGHHKPAEAAFRNALELWAENPAPVLNNLGLNLAAQGYIDEAIDTLRRALATAPNRTEIERNLRIVSALQPRAHQDASGYNLPPKPQRKPQS